MRRRDQFADVLRLDELAAKASGEIATAAVLANEQPKFHTIEAAAEFAQENPETIPALVSRNLQLRWMSEIIVTIRRRILELGYKKIGTYDAASQSTEEIFENVIRDINNDLKRPSQG